MVHLVKMKELNTYINEKLVIDKHIKIKPYKEPKEPKFEDYYLCYIETQKKPDGSKYKILHNKWFGYYPKNSDGRKQAEADSKKYTNFPDPSWKPMGVRTRSQVTTLGNKVDKYEWY